MGVGVGVGVGVGTGVGVAVGVGEGVEDPPPPPQEVTANARHINRAAYIRESLIAHIFYNRYKKVGGEHVPLTSGRIFPVL